MEIQIEDLSPVKKEVKITIPSENVNSELEKQYKNIRKKVQIPGFRKGKAPLSMVKKMYANSAKYEVMDKLINEGIGKAITENKINYVGEPVVKEVSELEENTDFSFKAEIECFEDFELKDYKGLKLEAEKKEVTDEMLENAIKDILKRFTYFEDIEDDKTPIEKGFQVVIEVEAFDGEEKIDKYSKEEVVMTVGENNFLPGFDDYLIGLVKGDETEVKHVVNLDGEEKELTFKIKVKWIKRPIVPELDEEFISQFGEEFKSVEDFKNKVKEDLQKNFDRQVKDELINKALQKLREMHDFKVPESIIKKTAEDYKKTYSWMNEEDLLKMAEERIKNTLILMKIKDKEDIKVTKEEIDNEIEQLAAQFQSNVEKIKELYKNNPQMYESLYEKLLTDKVLDFIIDNAEVSYVENKEDTNSEENSNEKNSEE